ncbi:MAG: hypothetical protein K0R84_1152 [Clostridia bacterium]|nr:hypothetical protein [Clostridia bacterium]
MEQKEYQFSEETIKQRKKVMNTMALCLPIIMIIFAFIITREMDSVPIGVISAFLGAAIALIVVEIIVVSRIMMKKLRQSILILSEDKLIHKNGVYNDTIMFKDIKAINVKKEKKGKILVIKLTAGKKIMNITGFENLSEVLEHLIQHAPEQAVQSEKTYKVNWNSPFVLALIMFITLAVIIVIMSYGEFIYQSFNALIMLGFGLLMLIYRPISRTSGSRFRTFEIVMGILLSVFSAIQLIIQLLIYFI